MLKLALMARWLLREFPYSLYALQLAKRFMQVRVRTRACFQKF